MPKAYCNADDFIKEALKCKTALDLQLFLDAV